MSASGPRIQGAQALIPYVPSRCSGDSGRVPGAFLASRLRSIVWLVGLGLGLGACGVVRGATLPLPVRPCMHACSAVYAAVRAVPRYAVCRVHRSRVSHLCVSRLARNRRCAITLFWPYAYACTRVRTMSHPVIVSRSRHCFLLLGAPFRAAAQCAMRCAAGLAGLAGLAHRSTVGLSDAIALLRRARELAQRSWQPTQPGCSDPPCSPMCRKETIRRIRAIRASERGAGRGGEVTHDSTCNPSPPRSQTIRRTCGCAMREQHQQR